MANLFEGYNPTEGLTQGAQAAETIAKTQDTLLDQLNNSLIRQQITQELKNAPNLSQALMKNMPQMQGAPAAPAPVQGAQPAPEVQPQAGQPTPVQGAQPAPEVQPQAGQPTQPFSIDQYHAQLNQIETQSNAQYQQLATEKERQEKLAAINPYFQGNVNAIGERMTALDKDTATATNQLRSKAPTNVQLFQNDQGEQSYTQKPGFYPWGTASINPQTGRYDKPAKSDISGQSLSRDEVIAAKQLGIYKGPLISNYDKEPGELSAITDRVAETEAKKKGVSAESIEATKYKAAILEGAGKAPDQLVQPGDKEKALKSFTPDAISWLETGRTMSGRDLESNRLLREARDKYMSDKGIDPEKVGEIRANYDSGKKALSKLDSNTTIMVAGETAVKGQLSKAKQLYQNLLDKGMGNQLKVLNTLDQWRLSQITDPDFNALKGIFMSTIPDEFTKVVVGTGGGGLADREKYNDAFTGMFLTGTMKTFEAGQKAMEQDMSIRTGAYRKQAYDLNTFLSSPKNLQDRQKTDEAIAKADRLATEKSKAREIAPGITIERVE